MKFMRQYLLSLLLIVTLSGGAFAAADLGNTAVISPTDASNGSGTCPSWLGSAAPSTLDDAGRCLQGAIAREWQNRSFSVTSTGSANAYVVAYTVAPAAYRTGQVYSFITNFGNTGTATVNINILGAKTIKKDVAGTLTALSSGDMGSGQFVMLAYNGTDMIWVNWQGGAASAASESAAGVVELATDAETITGTDTARAITPANLAAKLATAAATAYSPGAIYGLVISNAVDTANDITIAAGKARDEADTENIVLASAITKQLDAAWAAGTNQGCMNTGAEAVSTWYEVILIEEVTSGTEDVMCSTTANRATLPSGYDVSRRIGWIRNDGASALLQFTQVGDHFTWTTQVNDVSASVTATAAAATLTAPPNAIARFRAGLEIVSSATGDTATIVFSEVAEGNVTPAHTTGISSLSTINGSATDTRVAGHFELRVDSSSQIEHDSVLGASDGATFDISTFGFIDTRVRLGP